MNEKHHFFSVAGLGAIGGSLVWLYGFWNETPPKINIWSDIAVSICLGAGAGVVFVFLIANTDRKDRARLFALAILSGFFWEPVWEGSRGLVEKRIEQNQVRNAEASIAEAKKLTESLDSVDEGQRRDLVKQIAMSVEEAASYTAKVDSVTATRKIKDDVNSLVSAIGPTAYRSLYSELSDTSTLETLALAQPSPESLPTGTRRTVQLTVDVPGAKEQVQYTVQVPATEQKVQQYTVHVPVALPEQQKVVQ